MKAHLFLENGVLKVTTEEIPVEPIYSDTVQHVKYHWQVNKYDRKVKAYESTLAGIKSRAVRVGNEKEAYEMGQLSARRHWNTTVNHKSLILVEGNFYLLDCEVKYENRCGCHFLPGPSKDCLAAGEADRPYKCVKPDTKTAILSPVAAQVETGQCCETCEAGCPPGKCLIKKIGEDFGENRGLETESQDAMWEEVSERLQSPLTKKRHINELKSRFTITRNK